MEGCTFTENSASGGSGCYLVEGAQVAGERTLFAFGLRGGAVGRDDGLSGATFSCSDSYGHVNGWDWSGCLEGQEGESGNFSADPQFCDATAGDYHLRDTSPCLPGHHPDGIDGGSIGAFGTGCQSPTGVPAARMQPTSWSTIKKLFR